MTVFVSLAHYSSLTPPPGVTMSRREADGGRTGLRKVLALVRSSVRLARDARRFDHVVLVTAGLELFVAAALLPRGRIVAVDWLMPSSRRLDVRWPLSRVARFVVVRRADTATLRRRFGVPAERTVFVPFPVTTPPEAGAGDDGYFYSAGWAHRDWPTLVAALDTAGVAGLLSVPEKLPAPPAVKVVHQLPPHEGRQWMKRARCVVLAFVDTDLPSGPLVLLDAMAHGKPVIVSDVGGARDYVRDGVSALVVPPGDVTALAAAVARMDAEPELRARLGSAAAAAVQEFDQFAFWAAVLDTVPDVVGARHA